MSEETRDLTTETVPEETASPENVSHETGMPGAEGTAVRPAKARTSFPPFIYHALDGSKAWWKRYLHDRGYLLIGAFLALLITYGLDIVMEIPPFGNGSVMVLDLNAQYVYFFEHLQRVLHGKADLLYSFSRSMGGEFMGIYAYYLASPFSYLVGLFPEGAMQEALTTIFLLKSGFLAYTFGWYLHKTETVKNRIAVIAFSILYAFTAYAVVMQHNTMWIDCLIWLPMVTYGIEQLVKYGKFRMFVIFLSLTVMSNFYIGWMVCIYVALYYFAYSIGHGDRSGNPTGEKNHFLKSFFRIGVWSLVAIAISMVIIWTAYYSLQFGKTTFSSPNWKPTFRFDFAYLVGKFFPGTYDTVRPEGLPFVYCGVLSLLLVPIYFMSSKFTNREKIGYGLISVFLVMSFTISTADIFWHGFQKPNWLNYRYSFLLCFLLLVMAYKAFTALDKTSLKPLVLIGAGLTGVVFWLQTVQFPEDNFKDANAVLFSLICIGVYLALIPLCVRGKSRKIASVVLLVAVCAEVFANGVLCIQDLDKDVVYTHYSYYNDYNEGIREIMETTMGEDTTFYRMEKNTMRKKNDAFVFGMRGIAGSTSTLNQSTLDFLDSIGYSAASHWSYYYTGSILNDSLLGIKYIASKDGVDYDCYPEAFTDSKGSYSAYLNPYALSIAFGASEKIQDYHAKDYPNAVDRLNAIYSMLLGSDEILEIYKPVRHISRNAVGLTHGFSGDYLKYSKTAGTGDHKVTFTFTVPVASDLVMYIGSEFPRKATFLYGNKELTMEEVETKRIISLGHVDPNVPQNVIVELDDSNLYVLSDCEVLYYVDYPLLEQSIEKLRSQELVTDPGCRDGKITGRMHIDKDNTRVFTTIAYDAGWRIYVDGKRVETEMTADALVSFRADAGDHTVVMKYLPNCFVFGLLITIAGIAVLVLACVFWNRLTKLRWFSVLFVAQGAPDTGSPDEPEEDADISEEEPEEDAGESGTDGEASDEETGEDGPAEADPPEAGTDPEPEPVAAEEKRED